MTDTLTLVSTTDSPEDVQAALTGTPVPPPADPPPAGEAKPETPPAGEPPPAEAKPSDEPPPVSETPEQKTAREKRMERIQSDIDVLWKKKHDIRRDVEAEEVRLATLKKELTDLAAKGLVPAGDTPPAPKAEPAKIEPDRPQPQLADVDKDGKPRFANYEEWVADLGLWNAELAEKRADARLEARLKADRADRDKQAADDRARIERESASRAATEHFAKHQTTIEEFRKAHADFDAVLADVADVVAEMKGDYATATGQPGERLFEVLDKFTLEDATNSAALVYHLAQHPDEMRQIVRLPIARQLIALGRLDSRLEGAVSPPGPSAKVPPTTKAPEPIKPVGGGPTAPSTVDLDKETFPEYKARREREERVRLGLPPAR